MTPPAILDKPPCKAKPRARPNDPKTAIIEVIGIPSSATAVKRTNPLNKIFKIL